MLENRPMLADSGANTETMLIWQASFLSGSWKPEGELLVPIILDCKSRTNTEKPKR